MRYWKFLKKFPVQTIVVKTVGKGDLDNLLERLEMIFRISIPVTVFARPDTGKIGYLETEEDLLSAPDEGDAPRAAEQRIGLIWLGVTRQSDEG